MQNQSDQQEGYTETSTPLFFYSFIIFLLILLVSFIGLFFYKQYSMATTQSNGNLPIPTTEMSISPTLPIPTQEPQEEEELRIDTQPVKDAGSNNESSEIIGL